MITLTGIRTWGTTMPPTFKLTISETEIALFSTFENDQSSGEQVSSHTTLAEALRTARRDYPRQAYSDRLETILKTIKRSRKKTL